MSGQLDRADPQTIQNMRMWLTNEGCAGWEGALDGTDEEVLDLMDRHYPGGSGEYVPNEHGRGFDT